MSVSLKCTNEEPFIYIPNSGTNGSHDISTFIIWSKVHTDFPEGWTDVHSYQQGTTTNIFHTNIFQQLFLISQSANMIGKR